MIKTLKEYYFDWLCEQVVPNCPARRKKYTKLLRYLFNKEFYWLIPMDENRYFDALELRDEFFDYFIDIRPVSIKESEENFERSCNVLEMLIALARRAVYDVVGDESYGNEGEWFWRMIWNLHLYSFDDPNFDREMTEKIVDIFLSRKYEPNGEGNIFKVRGDFDDMRQIEIWCQLCWYTDYFLSE